jgi:hypothetical protein
MDTPGSVLRSLRRPAVVLGFAAIGLVVSGCGIGDLGDSRDNVTAQQKKDAKEALPDLISDLQALDAAYASGDVAEAQSELDQAKAEWRKIVPAATVQDQSDIQIRFDRLSQNLSNRASAKTVSDNVKAFTGELHGDVEPGLG